MPHDLQAPSAAQVDLNEGHERKRQGGCLERRLASCAGPEGPSQGVRSQEGHHCGGHADGSCDGGRAVEHGSNPPRLSLSDVDCHPPYGGHVHAEPRGRSADEGELGGEGDRPEG